MLTAMMIAAVLASPVSDCTKRLKQMGAQDMKRAAKVCGCTGGNMDASDKKKDACYQNVYGWNYTDANTLVGACIQENGGPNKVTIPVCTCTLWSMIETKNEKRWEAQPAETVRKFVEEQQKACYERLMEKNPQERGKNQVPRSVPIFPGSEGQLIETSCAL